MKKTLIKNECIGGIQPVMLTSMAVAMPEGLAFQSATPGRIRCCFRCVETGVSAKSAALSQVALPKRSRLASCIAPDAARGAGIIHRNDPLLC